MIDEDTDLCAKLWKYCMSRVYTYEAGYIQEACLHCLLAVASYIHKVGAKNTLENVGGIVRKTYRIWCPESTDDEVEDFQKEECEQITDEARALVEYFASIEQDTGEAS